MRFGLIKLSHSDEQELKERIMELAKWIDTKLIPLNVEARKTSIIQFGFRQFRILNT